MTRPTQLSDAYELAAHVCGFDPADDPDPEVVEAELASRHSLDFSSFETVVHLLLPYTPQLQSPLSGEIFHAFGISDGTAWIALVKLKAKSTKPGKNT